MPLSPMPNHDDLQKLLKILPPEIQQRLAHHSHHDVLVEVVLDLGRRLEARFPGDAEYLSDQAVTQQQLQGCVDWLAAARCAVVEGKAGMRNWQPSKRRV